MNDAVINQYGEYQFGGYAIANYKKNARLTYKMGVYINGDFFGLFVIPLLGIDWQINEKDNLFGVLPASLNYEHKLNNHFYTGAVFAHSPIPITIRVTTIYVLMKTNSEFF